MDMTRTKPGGATTNRFEIMVMKHMGRAERAKITERIAANDGGPTVAQAELPSAHLRYGLKVMRERGWSNEDWGDLYKDGPLCILASVRVAFDCPSTLDMESPEQYYIRKAFVQLGLPSPLYVAVWNDEQTEFSTIELVMETAIYAAEADESRGETPYRDRTQESLAQELGIDLDSSTSLMS